MHWTIHRIVYRRARDAISMKRCELTPIDAKAVSALNQLVVPLLSEHLGLIPFASEHVVGLISLRF